MFQNLRPFGNEGLLMCIRTFAINWGLGKRHSCIYHGTDQKTDDRLIFECFKLNAQN